MQSLTVTRYVQPLREGGSLPAIVEASDDGLYVMKFRGAGQGRKALVAEVIAAELARALGLPMPKTALLGLDRRFGLNEPHDEIRDLLNASVGLNFGIDYLPGSITFDPVLPGALTPMLASQVVWFDALVLNVDRTARNPNLLTWHSAALAHRPRGVALLSPRLGRPFPASAKSPFAAIKDHVLLPFATKLDQADAELARALTPDVLRAVLAEVPTESARR